MFVWILSLIFKLFILFFLFATAIEEARNNPNGWDCKELGKACIAVAIFLISWLSPIIVF